MDELMRTVLAAEEARGPPMDITSSTYDVTPSPWSGFPLIYHSKPVIWIPSNIPCTAQSSPLENGLHLKPWSLFSFFVHSPPPRCCSFLCLCICIQRLPHDTHVDDILHFTNIKVLISYFLRWTPHEHCFPWLSWEQPCLDFYIAGETEALSSKIGIFLVEAVSQTIAFDQANTKIQKHPLLQRMKNGTNMPNC